MLAVDDPQPVSAAPLRLASDEAAAACAALGVPAQRLSGEEATAEAVAAALPAARTLHLACHAHSDPQHPWDSAVVMAHDEPLTMRRLQALRLRARLAVLSACETGHSSYRLLDEAIGMPSALLQAGVAGVIASLWRVSDEATMPLMVAFYDRLRADPQRPALALREAQRWLRDTTSGEKRESFERRLERSADGWPPRAVTEACYAAVALDDPDELAHAAPADWAGFALIGA
jgi:CHAT domain-containing protein